MDFDPGLAVGRSRVLLFVGTVGIAGGVFLETPFLGWGSLAVVTLAFAWNAAGKVVHYRELPIGTRHRRVLIGSWLLLSVAVVLLFGVFLADRFGTEVGVFWPLAIATAGLGLVHRGLQREYLGHLDVEVGSE